MIISTKLRQRLPYVRIALNPLKSLEVIKSKFKVTRSLFELGTNTEQISRSEDEYAVKLLLTQLLKHIQTTLVN